MLEVCNIIAVVHSIAGPPSCLVQEVKSLSIPAITSTESIVNSSLDTTTVEWITNGFRPEIAAEINVWSVITQELVRQVYFHCEERGILLHRARARLLEV